MFLNATVAASSFINVGISGAIIKLVSGSAGQIDRNQIIGRVANTALGMALASGLVMVPILIIILLLGLKEMSLNHADLFFMSVAMGILVIFEFIDSVLSSVLKGGEHFRETARIEILFKTIQTVTALAVVVKWTDLKLLYAVLILVNMVRIFTKMHLVRRVYGIRRFTPEFCLLPQLIMYAKWGWLHGVGGFFLATADKLLIGYRLGSDALAYYSLLLMIPQQMHAVASAALSVSFPKMSGLLSSGRIEEVKTLNSKLSVTSALLVLAPIIMLIIFQKQIFYFWLKKDLPSDVMVALTPLGLSFILLALNTQPYYTLMAMGKVRDVAIISIIAGIACLLILNLFLGTGGLYIAGMSKFVYAIILSTQFIRVKKGLTEMLQKVRS